MFFGSRETDRGVGPHHLHTIRLFPQLAWRCGYGLVDSASAVIRSGLGDSSASAGRENLAGLAIIGNAP